MVPAKVPRSLEMPVGEVLPLRWERVEREELVFRVDETKTGAPLELPVTGSLRPYSIGGGSRAATRKAAGCFPRPPAARAIS